MSWNDFTATEGLAIEIVSIPERVLGELEHLSQNALAQYLVSIPERVLGELELETVDIPYGWVVVSIPERVLGELEPAYHYPKWGQWLVSIPERVLGELERKPSPPPVLSSKFQSLKGFWVSWNHPNDNDKDI